MAEAGQGQPRVAPPYSAPGRRRRRLCDAPSMDEPAPRAPRAESPVVQGFIVVAALAAVMWVVEIADQIAGGRLDRHGIEPRELDGLDGIVFAPFLHSGFDHLIGNTIPFLLLGFAIALGGADAGRGRHGDRRARRRPRDVARRAGQHRPHRRERHRLRLRRLPRRARRATAAACCRSGSASSCSPCGGRRCCAGSCRRTASRGRATCSARSAASSPRGCCTAGRSRRAGKSRRRRSSRGSDRARRLPGGRGGDARRARGRSRTRCSRGCASASPSRGCRRSTAGSSRAATSRCR